MTRPAARWLASSALVLFAVGAMVSGLDRGTEQQPGMARLVPHPWRSHTWLAEAAQRLGAGDHAGAEKAAAGALIAHPLDRRSAAFLGAARTMQGDAEGASAAFAVADALGKREPLTQAHFFGRALDAGDYRGAADRVDILLRAHPELQAIQVYLAQLDDASRGRAELMRRVASDRHWANAYLDGYAVDMSSLSRRARHLSSAEAAGVPCMAVTPFVRALEERNLKSEAREVSAARCGT